MTRDYEYPDVEPIDSTPGVNVEADAFNVLLAAKRGEFLTIKDIVASQDRLTNEKVLACVLTWFVNLLDNVPTVAEALLLHHRKVIIDAGEDVWTARDKVEGRTVPVRDKTS